MGSSFLLTLLFCGLFVSASNAQNDMPDVMPILDLTPQQFASALSEGRVDVIADIRVQSEWDKGHLPDATRKYKKYERVDGEG